MSAGDDFDFGESKPRSVAFKRRKLIRVYRGQSYVPALCWGKVALDNRTDIEIVFVLDLIERNSVGEVGLVCPDQLQLGGHCKVTAKGCWDSVGLIDQVQTDLRNRLGSSQVDGQSGLFVFGDNRDIS